MLLNPVQRRCLLSVASRLPSLKAANSSIGFVRRRYPSARIQTFRRSEVPLGQSARRVQKVLGTGTSNRGRHIGQMSVAAKCKAGYSDSCMHLDAVNIHLEGRDSRQRPAFTLFSPTRESGLIVRARHG